MLKIHTGNIGRDSLWLKLVSKFPIKYIYAKGSDVYNLSSCIFIILSNDSNMCLSDEYPYFNGS